ncbi:WbqC family protein [Chitiniphilus purpureus]|uniref:WbqC family protein n=1 Tax=Chitiniphilus purpureus TaxID=2981137 RepID=A0ABY6DJF2_9NEIS|nr:WbqC family protein [Chitiniphilus sp. CD1]UXY14482.1 WbqC family protein [Chitiniphilus sp. CD1]
MKLAIMQPYFFPYIGYFQLLSQVDKFVFYDDVNYIKSGWINRNRLFLNHEVRYITVPVLSASSFVKINKTLVRPGVDWVESLFASLRQSYRRAPYFEPVTMLIREVFEENDGTIGDVARRSVMAVADYLGLERQWVLSSSSYGNDDKRSVDRIVDICAKEAVGEYWNLPGGKSLYRQEDFDSIGVRLGFVDVTLPSYPQFAPEFVPGLSIIDALMFNDKDEVCRMLEGAK